MNMSNNNISDDGESLLSRKQVCKRVGKTFPTIWGWMQAGKFPRARDNNGQPAWLESEVTAWIKGLPIKPYKGDPNADEVNAHPIRNAQIGAEAKRRAAAKQRRENVKIRTKRGGELT
jgi:predicted DNA-binding transcriptional regulator AlpA